MRVVDASLVLGWLLGQPARPGSHDVLEGHLTGREALVAPELLCYEVANVLVTGARLPGTLAVEACAHFFSLEIATYSLGEREVLEALALAARYRVTVYDASYVALAQALNCPLFTADARLARKLPRGTVELV